jgi:hypothetical protein
MRCVLTCLTCCLIIQGSHAAVADDMIRGGGHGTGLVVPFYVGMEHEPSAVFQAKRFFRDYERKGFFKIGVLPIAVFEGVTVEVKHADSVSNSLAELRDWLGRDGARRVELRRVELLITSSPPCRVFSGRVRFLDNGQCRLFEGVTMTRGTNEVSSGSAVLQLSGARAGQIVFETSPPITSQLSIQNADRTTTLTRKDPD